MNISNNESTIKGTVIGMTDNEVIVDVSLDFEGVIPLSEFKNIPVPKEGDSLEVCCEGQRSDGHYILSHKKALFLKSWERVKSAYENGEIVNGYVKNRTKGGLIVEVFGLEAFLPGSQIDVKPIRDYDVFVDSVMEFKVVKINQEFKNVVVSHKALIEDELEAQKAEIISKLEKGQILEGVVKNITSYGVFVDIGGVDGLIHITDLSWDNVQRPEDVVKLGEKIKVVILDFDDDKKRVALGIKQLALKEFALNYQPGTIFEAEVVKIQKSIIRIRLGNVEGIVTKEETNWNEIDSLENLLFEGEIISAVFLRCENNQLFFSLKLLNEKPYDDKLYDLSLSDLLKFAGHDSNVFIGQAKQSGNFAFIEFLYSCGENQEGRLLIDPIYGYNLKAVVTNQFDKQIVDGEYYKVELSNLVGKKKRLERNQLFQFTAEIIDKVDNPYQKDVEDAFKRHTTDPSGNISLVSMLDEVGRSGYSSNDRVFYELLQNADDAAPQKGVSVSFNTSGDYLIMSHDGFSFNKYDFEAITSAANGTKKSEANTTGYKGIGFKSVFLDSQKVFISSSGYNFKFDKSDNRFNSFEDFYINNNPLINKDGWIDEDAKHRFLSLYSSARSQFVSQESIPWQLEPIWVDSMPVYTTSKNVTIFLEIGKSIVKVYEDVITNIFQKPEFMLFLRSTNRIDFKKETITRSIKRLNNKHPLLSEITIKNSYTDGDRVRTYKKFDFSVSVSDDAFEEYNIDLRIKSKNIDGKEQRIFVRRDGTEINARIIPPKIAINSETTISFAIPCTESGDVNPLTKKMVSLYAFLPTSDAEYWTFPFFLNANFILMSNRESIQGDNVWNDYLLQKIAGLIVELCKQLSVNGDGNALKMLLMNYFSEESPRYGRISKLFNSAYKNAIETEAFILNHNDELAKQVEIIIDKTELSEIIGADLFCKLLGTDKCLPSEHIDSRILSNQIFQYVEHVDNDKIHCKLINNEVLNDWYIHADQKSKDGFNKWLIKNELRDVINTLPIFKFDNEWKTPSEIDGNENFVVLSTKFSHLKSILIKLGLSCSNVFDEDDLFKIDETKLFERIYKKIEAHNLIVKELHHYRDICCGVGAEEYYYLNYYQSLLSDIKEGGFLSKEHEQLLSQIKPDYFSASDFDMSESDLDRLNDTIRDHFIFNDFPDAISRIIVETALTPQEKLMLIKTDFYGIGEARIKEIELFYSIDNASFYNGGEPASLQRLLPYRVDAPGFVKPYMICEAENFPELLKYLIDSEKEFEKVVMPHLTEILGSTFSLADIASQYKEGQQLRSLIETNDSNDSLKQLLPFVESSDDKTKEFFLNKIVDIRLSEEHQYKKDSFEYRVLKLALDVYRDAPSVFSSKIYFDGQCINEFTVSDDVVCDFIQNGHNRTVSFSLAKLLPHQKIPTGSVEKFRSLFEIKKDLDKLFNTIPKPIGKIVKELENKDYLGLCPGEWIYNKGGNAAQYLFYVYYYREKCKYQSSWVISIKLENETKEFVYELLDFLYGNKIDIKTSPFTYRIDHYFVGKFFNSNYISEKERLFSIIEQWANNDEKKKYLLENGVKDDSDKSIQFRKYFLEDKNIDFLSGLSDKDVVSGITYFATADGIKRPFQGKNQESVLLSLKNNKAFKLSDEWNIDKMHGESFEWNSIEYNEWKEDGHPHIFIFPSKLPSQLKYNDVLLLYYEDADCDYYYYKQTQKIFISHDCEIEDALFELAKEGKSDFDFDDYRRLFLEGKVTLSKEDIAQKDKTIETLSESNRQKDEIIEQYRVKYGDLEGDGIAGAIREEVSSINVLHHNAQDEIDLQRGRVIERDGLSEEKQVAAHKEASEIIREKLEEDGYDCSNWILDDDNDKDEIKKWHSFNQVEGIVNPEGDAINLVVKSAKGGYIYLSATDFEFLTSNSNNVLMVWDGNSVHSVSADEIFNKDSNVNLIFDTEYTPKHYYAALSKVFQYVKRTTFAVKNPCYNVRDSVKSFGMDSMTEGVQDLFDDNDL